MLGGVHVRTVTSHALEARRGDSRRRMWIALAINVALLAVEAVGGVLTGSLAVLADAGHLLSDVGSIALALAAARLASRPAGGRRTFGYQRSEVLAALVNGLLLVAVGVGIAVAAIGRLGDPPAIDGGGVLALGALGLAGNLAATLVLARGQREDINLEGVLRHSAADALGSLGVVVAGAVVLAGGSPIVDPIVGLLHRRSRPRLLLAADQGALRRADGGGAGRPRRRGLGAADLLGGRRALGPRPPRLDGDRRASARSPPTSSSPRDSDRDLIRRRLEVLLAERFGIEHTTLQMEEEAEEGLLRVENAPRGD